MLDFSYFGLLTTSVICWLIRPKDKRNAVFQRPQSMEGKRTDHWSLLKQHHQRPMTEMKLLLGIDVRDSKLGK